MVLSMGVLVMAAILPLVPTYIDNHIQQLFGIFCDLAIIRTTKRLGKLRPLPGGGATGRGGEQSLFQLDPDPTRKWVIDSLKIACLAHAHAHA